MGLRTPLLVKKCTLPSPSHSRPPVSNLQLSQIPRWFLLTVEVQRQSSSSAIFNWYAARTFSFLFLFFKDFIYLLLERGKGGRKRGVETSMCGCLSHVPNGEPGPQPRHVPWLGINQWPFSSQAGAQSTEPHQPGLSFIFIVDTITDVLISPRPMPTSTHPYPRIFETCKAWLFSQGHWPLLLDCQKNDNSQHNNSHPVWMNKNYTYFFFCQTGKKYIFWCAAEFSN